MTEIMTTASRRMRLCGRAPMATIGHFQPFVRSTRKAVFTSETVVVTESELLAIAYFSIIKLVYSYHHHSLGILKCLPLYGATVPLETTVF